MRGGVLETKLISRRTPAWKKFRDRTATVIVAVGLAAGTALTVAAPAQAVDDPAAHAIGIPLNVGYGTADGQTLWAGSQWNPNSSGLTYITCIKYGDNAGTAPSAIEPITGEKAAWMAYLQAQQAKDLSPMRHAATFFIAYDLFDPNGAEVLRNAPDPKIPEIRAYADQLLAEAKQKAGPYTVAPSITVTDDQSGTGTVTAGKPVSAAGVALDGYPAEVTLTGAVFTATGKATATLNPGEPAQIKDVAAGTKPKVDQTTPGLTGETALIFRGPIGADGKKQQDTIGADLTSFSGAAEGFRKFDQRIDSQAIYQGGFQVADELYRTGAAPGTTADVTLDYYITGQKPTAEGQPEAPADARVIDSQVVTGVADTKKSGLFDEAKLKAGIEKFRADTGINDVTGYIVATAAADEQNSAFVSNHLIASESTVFTGTTTTVVTETKETVKETVKTVEVPVINAGYAVPVQAASASAAGQGMDGSVWAGGAAVLLALMVGAGFIRARQAR